MARSRVPTSIRLATGTHRADRHGDPEKELKAAELKVKTSPPRGMNAIEKKTWKEVLKILAPRGLATELDVLAITAYCQDMYLLQKLIDDIETLRS